MLERAARIVFHRLKQNGGDPRTLGLPEQTVAVIYGAQGVIDNGGFRYFFENNWPGRPPYSLFSDAYRRIDATDAADCLDRAVRLFPSPRPHLAMGMRNRFMDALPEDDQLFALGGRVCGDTTVWTKLERYVGQHTEAFWRRPNDALQRTSARRRAPSRARR